jgi:hypothetical protein
VSGLLSELRADEDFVHQQINNNELLSYYLRSMKDDGIDVSITGREIQLPIQHW